MINTAQEGNKIIMNPQHCWLKRTQYALMIKYKVRFNFIAVTAETDLLVDYKSWWFHGEMIVSKQTHTDNDKGKEMTAANAKRYEMQFCR